MKWILLTLTVVLGLVALWLIYSFAEQIRASEQQKVTIWANAISQKAQLMESTETFFSEVGLDERRKMELYIDVLRSFDKRDLSNDADFSLTYVSYIVDSSMTPFIIMNKDSIITSCCNILSSPAEDAKLIGQKANTELLEMFSKYPPFDYSVWGIPLTLMYDESQIFSDLRKMLTTLNESFLSEIINNSVFVPVIVVDSLQEHVIGAGNINSNEFNTPERLADKLCSMQDLNEPIEVKLPNNTHAYVFYESTPLLKLLRFLPVLYALVAIVLIVVSFNLLRTARNNEENRIWVGMAKETAHQLGTPISSLIAWTDYLEGKTFDEPYIGEVRKDIDRLETIAKRFSKIGSVPELKEENLCEVITHTINYMEKRVSRKITFQTTLPDNPVIAPINRYLFEWVIENICKNAIDAMEGSGTFSTILTIEGDYICIDLADTGKGIPAAEQKMIFESGFTTKQRGWGLGLSLAKRIIKEYHRGKIFLKYSVPGQGSVFRIMLHKTN